MLTKGLGMGTFGSAERSGKLSPEAYEIMVTSGSQMNAVGAILSEIDGVSAATDVSGFGLLGHTLEIARASGLSATLRSEDIPILRFAADLAREGFSTGGAIRNWNSYGVDVHEATPLERWHRKLLSEPETSGGLLIGIAQSRVPDLLTCLQDKGFHQAAVIGDFQAGAPGVRLI